MKIDKKKGESRIAASIQIEEPMDKTILEQMIARHPRILRAKVINALRNLESAIRYVNAPGSTYYWLERYRLRVKGSPVPWFGLYPLLDGYVQELDSAIRAIHEYRVEDYVSSDAREEIAKIAGEEKLKANARKGGEKKNQENRALKEFVFEWLDANRSRFPSMDSTAEAIAGKIAPIKFRAARAWVGEWKKLRSASRT